MNWSRGARALGVPPAHRGTTSELRALFPFVVPGGLGPGKCFIGLEACGEPFCFDPWGYYATGRLTSPNMVVIGQIGRGKSAFVKSFLWRQRRLGRRCFVLDPKGEYGALARACHCAPLSVAPGLGVRLNPLDVPAGEPPVAGRVADEIVAGGPAAGWAGASRVAFAGVEDGERPHAAVAGGAGALVGDAVGERPGAGFVGGTMAGEGPNSAGRAHKASTPTPPGAHRRRSELLGTLLSASLGRPLLPAERAAADVALRAAEERLAVPTLAAVAEAMLHPEHRHAHLLGTDPDGLRHDGRQVALELRRLVAGDLAGMFDGETSPGVDLGAEVVVLDLSRLYGSAALGLLMLCALSWLQSALVPGSPVKRLLVLDEAWAVLSQLSTARWLQAAFKLSRAYGVANIAVLHRLSDLRAAGHEGSEQQQLAEGLLSDAETRVVFAQAAGEAEVAGELLGLSQTERQLVTRLPRGVALWRVGQESYLVEHQLSGEEQVLADTDSAMREAGGSQGR